ncbi:MAG: hypothetical protein ACLP9L_16050 [Thermoguttaceae bacterium]
MGLFLVMSFLGAASPAAAKTLIDYFLPTPIHDRLESSVWGAAAVGPRDIQNGLEDATMKKWCYWDGKIIKGPDGKYHITSADGIKDWKLQGLACDPTKDFIRYTDGTVNHWNKIERPGVLIEDGRVTCFTFAVIDVEKSQDRGNDNHGSKVIVVPFDGVAFDKDMQNPSAAAQTGNSASPRQ